MSKETATAVHGDLRDLLGRLRDLQRAESSPLGFPAAFSLARYHVEAAARALLPLIQREEDAAMREHIRAHTPSVSREEIPDERGDDPSNYTE